MAEEHLVHRSRIYLATSHRPGYGSTPELDGTEGSEGTAVLSDRGSGGAGDDWVAHSIEMLPATASSNPGLRAPLSEVQNPGFAV